MVESSSARLLRERLAAEVPELDVIAVERLAKLPGVAAVDPTHVLIETAPIGLTGYQADDWIRGHCDLRARFDSHTGPVDRSISVYRRRPADR